MAGQSPVWMAGEVLEPELVEKLVTGKTTAKEVEAAPFPVLAQALAIILYYNIGGTFTDSRHRLVNLTYRGAAQKCLRIAPERLKVLVNVAGNRMKLHRSERAPEQNNKWVTTIQLPVSLRKFGQRLKSAMDEPASVSQPSDAQATPAPTRRARLSVGRKIEAPADSALVERWATVITERVLTDAAGTKEVVGAVINRLIAWHDSQDD